MHQNADFVVDHFLDYHTLVISFTLDSALISQLMRIKDYFK